MTTPFNADQLLTEASKWHDAMFAAGLGEVAAAEFNVCETMADLSLEWSDGIPNHPAQLTGYERLGRAAVELANAAAAAAEEGPR